MLENIPNVCKSVVRDAEQYGFFNGTLSIAGTVLMVGGILLALLHPDSKKDPNGSLLPIALLEGIGALTIFTGLTR